jgi:hypothetical protein
MESPEKSLEKLDKLIRTVMESNKPNETQIWELENFYEQAKIYYSQGSVLISLAMLQRLRTLRGTDNRLTIIRARAEGYSDAVQVAARSVQPPVLNPTITSTPVNINEMDMDPEGNRQEQGSANPANTQQKSETKKWIRPPVVDL